LPAAAQDTKRGSLDPAEQLRVRAEWIAWREAGRYRTTSAPDGTWRIEGLPDFAFQIEGSATGWTLKVRGDVARGSRAGDTVELVGVPLVSLTLDVRRDGGGSPPSAMIGLRSRQSSASRTWTPSQPAFDLEPGSYDVVLSIKSAQSSFRPVERVPVTLKAGPNAAEIAIPELHSVTIVVDDAPANATLSLRPVPRTADFRSDQRIGKDGKAEFTRLTPGEYRIQMYGTGRLEEMRVTIPGDREVRFAPKPLNALAVTVDDPAGYLAKVGFQSGDIIVGMEGKEFQNLMEVQAIFFGVQGTEDVQLKVLRGGQEVTVTFQPKKAMAADGSRALGGGFDAVSR